MNFKSGTRRRANEYEQDLTKYWNENKIFEKSVELKTLCILKILQFIFFLIKKFSIFNFFLP